MFARAAAYVQYFACGCNCLAAPYIYGAHKASYSHFSVHLVQFMWN